MKSLYALWITNKVLACSLAASVVIVLGVIFAVNYFVSVPEDFPDFPDEVKISIPMPSPQEIIGSLVANYTKFSSSRCKVHDVEMRIEIVPISYGTPLSMFRDEDGKRYLAPGEIDPDIRYKLFPRAMHLVWGGCCVGREKSARTYICSECEREEAQWKKEHDLPGHIPLPLPKKCYEFNIR